MKILSFIFNNASEITFLLLLLSCIITAFARKDFAFLKNAAFGIVTDAEKKYGSSTGELKKAFAADKIYQKMPSYLKAFISSDTVMNLVEKALENAKKKWSKNPSLISSEKEGGICL